jgi:hypothetical protein
LLDRQVLAGTSVTALLHYYNRGLAQLAPLSRHYFASAISMIKPVNTRTLSRCLHPSPRPLTRTNTLTHWGRASRRWTGGGTMRVCSGCVMSGGSAG